MLLGTYPICLSEVRRSGVAYSVVGKTTGVGNCI
jgi:hypothetical protein